MSKNTFEIVGERVTISHPDWDFLAFASVKDEYADELQSVTWSKKGEYLYSSKLKVYLHVYIMRKWYGDDVCRKMNNEGCVVDHLDNNGHNCCIENLSFLLSDENKAKGMTLDKMSADRSHIALSMFKDFNTQLFQITIFFNYPPKVVNIEGLDRPAVIDLAYFLYDSEYEIVINDARAILYDYRRDYSFDPNRLHFIDYHIEGTFGKACPVELFDEYINGKHGHGIASISRRAPLQGWNKNEKKEVFCLHEPPGNTR